MRLLISGALACAIVGALLFGIGVTILPVSSTIAQNDKIIVQNDRPTSVDVTLVHKTTSATVWSHTVAGNDSDSYTVTDSIGDELKTEVRDSSTSSLLTSALHTVN